MKTELKPCPNCNSQKLSELHAKRSHRVKCWNCGHVEPIWDWNRRAMPECVRWQNGLINEVMSVLPARYNVSLLRELRASMDKVQKYYEGTK